LSLFTVTLEALAPLFLLVLLGYGLKWARVLHPAHVPIFNSLVLNVTLPALIIKGLMESPPLVAADALPPLALLLTEGVTLTMAWAAGRALSLVRPMRGALLMTGPFGNSSFLGYPITLALLPGLFSVTILLDQFGMTILMYFAAAVIGATFGTSTAGEARDIRQSILRFLRSPLFLSLVLGCVMRLTPWPPSLGHLPVVEALDGVLAKCRDYLGQGTTPLVLLALGVALRPDAVRSFPVPIGVSCLLKLIVTPLLMWAACRAFGLHGDLLRDGILIAAMPTAVMASVLSAEHDLAGDFAVGVVFTSTVLSAVTVPLMLSILR
jgi:predicted permease